MPVALRAELVLISSPPTSIASDSAPDVQEQTRRDASLSYKTWIEQEQRKFDILVVNIWGLWKRTGCMAAMDKRLELGQSSFLRLPSCLALEIPCCWKLLPEVYLGILYANKYAEHTPLLWTTRIFEVNFLLLGRTNWERITKHIPIFGGPKILLGKKCITYSGYSGPSK